ncbi:hypothetical protein SLEP1_g42870 [Rubroshorea leprosula]|uniref:Phorbol-ester/DAG-type domain-containing protein n=1 Tax=Rubroshorea leprosula TaxID=152421 RepID=A0AAV5LBM3_9ROSI|nr:hypothetical protein SLEP1_g42870 [Rubroshorea leprosula]
MKKLNHFSHPHPLVLVEDQEMDSISIIYYCSACQERVEGSSYNCSECDFCLHKSCAELPREINHPSHLNHSLILYEKRQLRPVDDSWFCDSCRKRYKPGEKLFVYRCSSCDFDLDIECALIPNLITRDLPKSQHFSHQHSLFFIKNHHIEPKDRSCYACEEQISGPFYGCFSCLFFLHEKCFELPPEIKHLSHHKHSLTLLANPPSHYEKCCCRLCSKPCKGFIYYCSPCEFGFKPKYAFSDDVIESKNHEHPFTLLSRPISFICDACGSDGDYCIPYVCIACNLFVHKECISLLRKILITRHDHPVSHIYFLEEKEVNETSCKICHDEIKTEHGCYHCRDCDYFAHVNCAMDKDIFIREYEVTDENQSLNEKNLGWLSGEPSITHVLKKRKIGEEVIAIEIKHFNHRHELILCDDVKDEKCCDGCMRSISTSFYYCNKCNYILHKRCAELPRKTRHWAFKDTFTLMPFINAKCQLCCFTVSGLTYHNDVSGWEYCILCFIVPDTITQGHEHPVFFDHKFTFKCSICVDGHEKRGAFICKRRECHHFTLNYTSLVLPITAWCKYDDHPLVLTYCDDIHRHLDQCVCDICEEPRNPDERFYYCKICDNSAHFLCVLGKYPFLRLGLTTKENCHEHLLSFAKEHYYQDYSRCSVCGKYCKEVFLKCTQSGCEYAVDWECR